MRMPLLALGLLTGVWLAGCGGGGTVVTIPPATAPGGATITLAATPAVIASGMDATVTFQVKNAGGGTFGFFDTGYTLAEFDVRVVDAQDHAVAYTPKGYAAANPASVTSRSFHVINPNEKVEFHFLLRENYELTASGKYRVFVETDFTDPGAGTLHAVSDTVTVEVR